MLPTRSGLHEGLAYTLWLPAERAAKAGIVVVHGAGSSKESHYEFARAALATGFAALTFDQRGHGESPGRLDGRAVADVISIADLLRAQLGAVPVALRGSSLGGYLCLRAAAPARAAAVVAICPASASGLRRALEHGQLRTEPDREAVARLLAEDELSAVVAALEVPLLLLHAQGDEQVPVQHSRELAAAVRSAGSRLIEVPGGHHRSIQHDEEMQAVSLRFLENALGVRRPRTGP